MNVPDLSEGQRLLDAMTEAPWSATEDGLNTPWVRTPSTDTLTRADADAIVWLRNNAAALLAEAARARTLEAALRDLADSVAAHDIAAVAAVTDWQAYASKQIAITQARALLDTQEGP